MRSRLPSAALPKPATQREQSGDSEDQPEPDRRALHSLHAVTYSGRLYFFNWILPKPALLRDAFRWTKPSCTSRYAVTSMACSGVSDPGWVSGIVTPMKVRRSCADLNVPKLAFGPQRAGPIFPSPCAPWHTAHEVAKTLCPASANCPAVVAVAVPAALTAAVAAAAAVGANAVAAADIVGAALVPIASAVAAAAFATGATALAAVDTAGATAPAVATALVATAAAVGEAGALELHAVNATPRMLTDAKTINLILARPTLFHRGLNLPLITSNSLMLVDL